VCVSAAAAAATYNIQVAARDSKKETEKKEGEAANKQPKERILACGARTQGRRVAGDKGASGRGTVAHAPVYY